MELKKFEAPTLAEALQVIKRELGPEAIILATKNKKSSLGLLNRSSVEVTATVAPEALERKKLAESRLSPDLRGRLDNRPAQKVVQAYDILSGNRLRKEIQAASMTSRAPATDKTSARASAGTPAVRQGPVTQRRYIDITDDESPAEQATQRSADRAQLSSAASSLTDKYSMSIPAAAAAAPAIKAGAAVSSATGGVPGLLQTILAQVIEAGVEPELIRELGDELKMVMLREHITREDHLRMRFARILMSRLRVARPLGERLRNPGTPRVITFIGPTGVGKTTTIAKIAAEIVINQKRPVTLATTDTFKIAAVEQLQTYANILKVPLEVCPTAESLAHVNAQLGPDEVVLVDTAGYGPKDEKRLSEMHETLSGVRSEIHLCVAAMTRDSDLKEITRRFALFDPAYLVVTKLDETSMYGNIFNVCNRSHLPLSYFTMGQRVPEDIEVATRERVADLLLNIAGG
ncbi:MAG: flagellar biosynthesis protein FlhF [Bdellovibrionales bacterium]|nr:flagellar biosynthesis protein FlhF [Bdellovibrionales bacterium]